MNNDIPFSGENILNVFEHLDLKLSPDKKKLLGEVVNSCIILGCMKGMLFERDTWRKTLSEINTFDDVKELIQFHYGMQRDNNFPGAILNKEQQVISRLVQLVQEMGMENKKSNFLSKMINKDNNIGEK